MKYDRDGIIDQIVSFGRTHAEALDRLLGAPDAALPAQIGAASLRVVAELESGNAATARSMIKLFDGYEHPEWWATPLGIACYSVVGFEWPVIPRKYAVAILGVTRQRIAQLEQEGVLIYRSQWEALSGLTPDSVRARWDQYGPLATLDTKAQES